MRDFLNHLKNATPYELLVCLLIFGIAFAVLGV